MTAAIAGFRAAQHTDGGWGVDADYESNPLDTALALQALAATVSADGAPTALAYLLAQQQTNGAWLNSEDDPSIQITAQAFRALWNYRNTYAQVPPALTKARDFLLSQRDGAGSWGEQFNTALVLTALIPYLPDTSLIANSLTTLQSAQLSNGSWANDPYTTALALQALRAAELRGGGTIGSGAVSGYVVKAGSGEAIAGASVSLLEQTGISVLTNGDGYFLIPNLAGKGYTVTASKSGFSAASLAVNVVSGGVTLAGRLVLSPGTQGGFVNGKIFDATDLTALAGATVGLSGAGSYAGTTDAAGKFDLGAVAAGAYTVTVQKSGYSAITNSFAVAGGQTVIVNQGLTKQGAFPDTSPGTISGIVMNARTGARIAGAVFDLGGGLTGTSSATGLFSISGVPRGNYSATLSGSGYVTNTYAISFPAGSAGTLGALMLYPTTSDTPPTSLRLTAIAVDGITSVPIAGATVRLVETGAVVTTGTDGRAVLDGITLTSFNLALSAAGYQAATYPIQVSAFGDAQITLALAPPGSGAATSTLQGIVTNGQTSAPIPGALVKIDGTSLSTTTGADGRYRLSGIATLEFTASISAQGYAQKSSSIRLATHGDYSLDAALQPVAAASFQIISVATNQSSTPANNTALFTAQVVNLSGVEKSILIFGEMLDASGTSISNVVPYAVGTTIPISQFSFAANETKTLTVPWSTGQFAPGTYTLVLRVIEPNTISTTEPRGQVLAENSGKTDITATGTISGALAINPPLTQAGATAPVSLAAVIRNAGNVPLASGAYVLSITSADGGTTLFSAEVTGTVFDVGATQSLSFGQWVPTQVGNLPVTVRPRASFVAGVISGVLYVGDKASGTFTLDQTIVPEGTQTVRGRINVQGVDSKQGSATDPLVALLRESIQRGVQYVGPEAIRSLNSKQCTACHAASQSYYGLASAAAKANIGSSAEAFLYNSIVTDQMSDGSFSGSYGAFVRSQTLLGVWALSAAPHRDDSFRTRFRAAKYLYGQRTVNGNLTHWVGEINPGLSSWWDTNDASTAMAIGGLADVITTAPHIDPATIRDYSSGPGRDFGSIAWDMAVGPDGAMYLARHNTGRVDRMDMITGQITTVMSGLGTAYGLTFANDGTLYVTGIGHIHKRNPDGTTVRIGSNVGGLSIAIGSDGQLYTVAGFSEIYRVSPTTGNSEVFINDSRLISAYSVAADAAGNLLVANYGGSNILRIAPDRTITEFTGGMVSQPIQVKVAGDGQVYVTFSYGGRLVRVSPSGVVESLLPARLVATSGERLFVAHHYPYTLHEVQVSAMDLSLVNSLPAEVAAAARYLLSRYQDNSTDNMVQAQRMIGLARARLVVGDSALLADINSAIAYENTLLRGRQNADGGWGHLIGQPSDALVTAMVGSALNYANPAPDDLLVRNAIHHLLNTQGPDGSWANANNGLSTRLGATSFVMAYLPAALELLGGIDSDLHMEIGPNVTIGNPSVPPTTVTPTANGGQEYVWQFRGVTNAGRSLEFDMTLLNMQLDESRPAARAAYLEFANSFTNERLRLDLDIPTVRTASGAGLTVSTNKQNYVANEPVTVTSVVTNTSSSSISGQVLLAIRASGTATNLVDLAPLSVTNLAPGAAIPLTASWNTATTLSGSYEVYGRLFDAQNREVSQGVAPLTINAPATAASVSVTTDKPLYNGWDSVQINARVQNVAPNAVLAPSRVEITVRTPDGAVLYFDTRRLGELVPSGRMDVPFSLKIADAASGVYSVELVLKDDFTRAVLANAATTFQVEHKPLQGMTGNVLVNLANVNRGDPNVCNETARNVSASALNGVRLIHQLVNMDTSVVIDSVTETVDVLAGGQIRNYFRNINTGPLAIGGYSCVIKAELGSESRTLAFGGFRVIEPPVRIDAELKLGTKGRLLVLLDDPNRCEQGEKHRNDGKASKATSSSPPDKCLRDRDPHGPKEAPALSAQRAFLEALLKSGGWSYVITERAEDFTSEFRSGRYAAYAVLAEQEKLSEQVQKELREAVFRGDGLFVAGAHDARHHRLLDVLGVKLIGQVSNAVEAELEPGPITLTGRIGVMAGDKALRIKRITAQLLARYRQGGHHYHPSDDERDCCDHGKRYKDAEQEKLLGVAFEKGEEPDECEGGEDKFLDAMTTNGYGRGRSVFAGFDLLVSATRDGADSLAARTLLAGLALSLPENLPPRLGGVVPIKLALKNQGVMTDASATVSIGQGASVIDAGGGIVKATPLGETVTWSVNLQAGEERELVFYLHLPGVAGNVALQASVSVSAGGVSRVVAQSELTLTVAAVASLDALAARADALSAALPANKNALRQAASAIQKAAKASTIEKSVDHVLHAIEALLGLTHPDIVALRVDLDEWLRYTQMLVN